MAFTERQQNGPQGSLQEYESALEYALGEIEYAQAAVRDCRNALAVAEANANELFELFEKLGARLPPDRRVFYQQRATALASPSRAGRGTTTTYENVVELFANSPLRQPPREWSAPEVMQELAAKGIPADPDQIQNVFQYLAKKKRLTRVSRGRYTISVGTGVIGVEGDPEGGYE